MLLSGDARLPEATGTLPQVRPFAVLAVIVAVVAGISLAIAANRSDDGPDAPPVDGLTIDCTTETGVCAEHPTGWDVEAGDTFLTFAHPLDPDQVLGSVGRVNMEGLVTGAGGTWPAPPEEVVRAFFELLGQDQDAGLEGAPELLPDGSVQAEGRLEGLHLWYRLVPGDGGRGIGIEIRAPNKSWQPHADAWRAGLVVGAGS